MADHAQVTSFDALEIFRTNLILFLSKARIQVDDAGGEIRRTQGWLQNDQRLYWEREIRRRRRALDQAEAELLNAKMSNLRENLSVELMAARRAKKAFDEAEEKLQSVKRWARNFESCIAPLAKKLESLRGVLDHELPKAVSYLLETQKTLESYAEIGTSRDVRNPLPPTEETARDPATTQEPHP
ncbi:MAG: hypothetical protein WCO94_06195 [Verrucomicrobiota bacterium]